MTTQTTQKNNPLSYLFRMQWRYSTGNHPMVILYMIMSVLAAVVWSLEPLVVGSLLNKVQSGGSSGTLLWGVFWLLVGLLAIEAGGWAFHGPSRYIETKNAFYVKAKYKEHLIEGTVGLPIEWHTDHHSGNTIDKIEKGANGLYGFSENTFNILQAMVTLLAGVLALLYFDAFAAVAAMVFTFPTFFILALFDRHLVLGYKRVSALENETSAKVFDVLSNVTTVIVLRVESLVLRALETSIGKPRAQFLTNSKLNEWKWFSASILGRFASMAVIATYLIHQLSIGVVMVGTVYILYGYVDRIRSTFFQFASLYNDIIRWRANVANAEDLSKDFRNSSALGENRLAKTWKKLSLERLSFSYDGKDSSTAHLQDVSMQISKGARIALIGESGGGKSTFLKLLRDLYHPKMLLLSLDGAAVAGGFAAIRDSISLVPQDPEIFSTTIRENITLGVEYPESHIKVFTDMARFTDVVVRLPKGLESSIVEKGVNLSGGEKQRLALARGLLASEDKDIVLLDEPTSSVDFGNELTIYQNIFESFPNKAIISSIHRLHLLSLFDSVYLFKAGSIVASGSFDELKESSPEFQALWENYIKARDAGAE